MKMNLKTLIIVFLVGLLGSSIGTFGVMSYYNKNINNNTQSSSVVLNEVQYTSYDKSDYTKAIEKAYDTVVEITCTVRSNNNSNYFFFGGSSTSTSAGSGVILSEDGYIVTNAHVIENLVDEDSIQIKLYNGKTVGAKLIGYDTRTDLAVLKINENALPFASLVDSTQLVLGQDVFAIGNPLGLGKSVSNGIISALEKEIYVNRVYLTVIQTNAAVNAGNSGGGLFDNNGNLVGIVNAKRPSTYTTSVEGMGYAIPANTVSRIVSDIVEYGYVKDRATLGVRVYTTSGYYTSSGVMISEVIENGGAEKAGIKENDVIIAIDDTTVDTYADLSKALDSKEVGDIVTVTVLRQDEKINFDVVLQASSNS